MIKKMLFVAVLLALPMLLMTPYATAYQYELWGKELHVLGSLSNQFQISLLDDKYDTEQDLQQWLSTLQVMSEFTFSPDLTAYVSGVVTVDWIYDIKHDDSSWNRKRFDKSRSNLYLDDKWWQLLSEAHVTWSPGNFLFRFGKQLVKWGELESTVVLDLISPNDSRRGMGDVEFETLNIAIPMLRAEYWPQIYSDAFSSPNIQFVFIPNADFIPSLPELGAYAGNDIGGIYSANLVGDFAGLGFPQRIGRLFFDIDEPDDWDSHDFEYGLKLSAQFYGSILSVMGFYGRENLPVLSTDYTRPDLWSQLFGIKNPFPLQFDDDGNVIMNAVYHGYYPRQKFTGLSWVSDLPFLRWTAIGGVEPLVRLEFRYDFDKVIANENWISGFGEEYEELDVFTWGIGIEQKVRIRGIQKSYWYFSMEYTYAKVLDYNSNWALSWLSSKHRSENFAFFFETNYMNGKLIPSLWYARDITNNADMFWPGVQYTWSSDLSFYTGFGVFTGKGSDTFYGIENKDYFVFKITYAFD